MTGERELLELLHYRPDPAAVTVLGEARAEVFDAETVRQLQDQVNDEMAEEILGPTATEDELRDLLRRAEIHLEEPQATVSLLRAVRGEGRTLELPPSERFEGYDPAIEIEPDLHIFETLGDAPAWAVQAALAVFERQFVEKPKFTRHTSDDSFVYDLRSDAKGNATVALFSDWGTGYYHSQYIARHIARLRPAQAVHLGDVYYAGRSREFAEYFTPHLDPFFKLMPFYALNANHEMMARGKPYFDYLSVKQAKGKEAGNVPQPQRGSYFCLRNDRYQVIGLDTAYFKNGRLRDPGLLAWLRERLREGTDSRRVNVLLSQNEPYGPSSGPLHFHPPSKRQLLDDLGELKQQVSLWFWGDEHFAALYLPVPGVAPFIGSCIGHGGYPFDRIRDSKQVDTGIGAPIRWFEDEPRLPPNLDVHRGRGNNGFCMLTLGVDHVEVEYIDWRARSRHTAEIHVIDRGLRML
jgi:hypothetical protein